MPKTPPKSTRQRIVAPAPKEDASHEMEIEEEVEEEDEVELEDAQGEEEIAEGEIVVHYRERMVNRIFGAKSAIRSGGDLKRSFSEEVHGKKYRAVAMEFITTMLTKDEESSQRPKLLKVEGLDEDEQKHLSSLKN